MKLPLTVTSLEEIEERFRCLYDEQTDGSFKLNEALVPKPEPPPAGDPPATELQEALRREREARRKLEKQLTPLKGIDPAKHAELLQIEAQMAADREKAEEEKRKAEGRWEELKTALEAAHSKAIETLAAERDQALLQLKTEQGNLEGLSTEYENGLKRSALTEELSAVKANIPLLMPHLLPHLKVERDDKGLRHIRISDSADGFRRAGDGTPLTVRDLVAEFRARPEFKSQDIFPTLTDAGGSGAGKGSEDKGDALNKAVSSKEWIQEALTPPSP